MKPTATLCALLCVAALAMPARSAPPASTAPSAPQVVVRGGRDLVDLIGRATRPAWQDETASRAVAVVVDVTPHTRRAREAIEKALRTIGEAVHHLDGHWQVAALGRKLSPVRRHPTALALTLGDVFAAETPEVDTLGALGRTLRDFDARRGLVLYLADWRFEDDRGLETTIRSLQAREQTLTVIGSEACFERGWNDGLPDFGQQEYAPGIGRSPFGPSDPKAPWHGGDTAYPHVPWRFGTLPWRTEFMLGQDHADRMEDLLDRVRAPAPTRAQSGHSSFGSYPLPSGFGPYALMRAAGVTGGNYFLYSFNPSGRTDVVYDFGRLNLFPPDLRSRKQILPDARSNGLARALLQTWHLLAEPASGVVDVTPPLTRNGRPAEVERVEAPGSLPLFWAEKSEHRRFLHRAEAMLEALDEGLRTLDRALEAPHDADAIDRRLGADAELLRHTLAVLRFEVAEAVAVAKQVPQDAWDDEDVIPGIVKETWILPSPADEPIRHGPGRPLDREAAARLEKERVSHLRRFAGTPFGEIVGRNAVEVWRLDQAPSPSAMRKDPRARTPSESQGKPPTTPPTTPAPGGSTGGGPSTGR